MKQTDYAKNLLKIQKDYMKCQQSMIEVMTQMKESLVQINDHNVLHAGREDERYDTIEKLISAVESRSKFMNLVFVALTAAVIIIAGAEEALKFIL